MAEMNFFNYAKSVADAESIIGARQKNAINAYKLEDAQNIFKKRKEREDIIRQHADTPARVKALVDAGLYEGANELAESYYGINKLRMEAMETEASQLNPDTWDNYRYQKIQDGVDPNELPENYDPGWMNSQIKAVQNEIKNVTTILGPIGPQGQVMAQDTIRAGGKETTGQPYDYADTKSRSTAGGGPKAADANVIVKAIRNNFGSMINPTTGQFRILDRDTEAKIAGIQAEAQRLFETGAVPTQLEAVERALRDFDEPVANRPSSRDPLNIRGTRQ